MNTVNQIFLDNKKRLALFISTLLSVLSFYNDYLIFSVQGKGSVPPPYNMTWIWCLKVLYFFIVYRVFYFLACGKLRHFKFILSYFGIIFLFYIATYPGMWRFDDIINLGSLTEGYLYYWQHWLSSAYFYLCMMLFPSPSGIVFVQILIISFISGHIVGTAWDLFGRTALLLYIPLLMPSVIDSSLYPIRASICTFIELYIIFELVFWHISPNADRNAYKMCLLGILSAVLSAWRPEKILNLLIVLLFFLAVLHIGIKKVLCVGICSLAIMFSLMEVQSNGLAQQSWTSSLTGNKMSEKYLYALSGFVSPMGELVRKEVNNPECVNNHQCMNVLADIDKKISVQKITNEGGLSAFWNGGLKQLDQQDLTDLRKDYIYLAVHNFSDFFKERWANFALVNGILPNAETFPKGTAHIFDNAPVPEDVRGMYEEFKKRYIFNNPPELIKRGRVNIISFLEPRKTTDLFISSYPLGYFAFYNCIIPIIVSLGCIIWAIIKKKWNWLLLLFGVGCEFAIVVVAAPAPTFMYFYSTQLICWLIFIFMVLEEKNNKRKYSIKRGKNSENGR